VIIFSISVKVYTGIQRTLAANDQVLTSWYVFSPEVTMFDMFGYHFNSLPTNNTVLTLY